MTGDQKKPKSVDSTSNPKKKGSTITTLFLIFGIVAVSVWQSSNLKYLNWWVRNDHLNRADFAAGNFTVHGEVPTTYYEPGKLSDVLKEVCPRRNSLSMKLILRLI